jgi:hypothetical protein
MEESRKIDGREFDWFATDRDGSFALFATGGCGPAPQSVLASTEAHDAIGEIIDVTGWGSSTVWQSYSRVGLYAYDWSDSQGAYVRVAVPAISPSPKVAAAIAAIVGLPYLEVSFSEVASFPPDWQDGGR